MHIVLCWGRLDRLDVLNEWCLVGNVNVDRAMWRCPIKAFRSWGRCSSSRVFLKTWVQRVSNVRCDSQYEEYVFSKVVYCVFGSAFVVSPCSARNQARIIMHDLVVRDFIQRIIRIASDFEMIFYFHTKIFLIIMSTKAANTPVIALSTHRGTPSGLARGAVVVLS